jgi:hypothetical protein
MVKLEEALKYAEELLRDTVKDADTRAWVVSHCSSDLMSKNRMNEVTIHLKVSPPMQQQADTPVVVEGEQ